MKRQRNSFLTPLDVRVMESGKQFRLLNQFTYYYQPLDTHIRVAAGFVTDFASIPQPFHLIISKLGRYNKAAVIHDALYQGVIAGGTTKRKVADKVFLQGMVDLGVKRWKRNLMYRAVRLFGWMAWRKQK